MLVVGRIAAARPVEVAAPQPRLHRPQNVRAKTRTTCNLGGAGHATVPMEYPQRRVPGQLGHFRLDGPKQTASGQRDWRGVRFFTHLRREMHVRAEDVAAVVNPARNCNAKPALRAGAEAGLRRRKSSLDQRAWRLDIGEAWPQEENGDSDEREQQMDLVEFPTEIATSFPITPRP